MAEDKRLINSKTSYTLKELPMKVLEFYFNSPEVPKSMKDKLYEAIELKKRPLKGGLKGVSKASGFIRRLMWENSNKHNGSYKNPTWKLAPNSKMRQKAKFDWKFLASEDQGGLNKSAYGASPFITSHFKEDTPSGSYEPETAEQKKARKEFKKSQPVEEVKEAPVEEQEASRILHEHFGNASEPGRPGSPKSETIPETPKVEEKEEAKREWAVEDFPEDTQNWYNDLSEKEQVLFNFAINNPEGKLAGAIEALKEAGFTSGIAPSTVSPTFKEIKKEAKEAIEEALKAEEFAERSKPLAKLIEKKVKGKRLMKEAKQTLRDLKREKREKEAKEAREKEKAEAERAKKEKIELEKDKKKYPFPQKLVYDEHQNAKGYEVDDKAVQKRLELAKELKKWYEAHKSKYSTPVAYPTWMDRVNGKKKDYPQNIQDLVNHDYKLASLETERDAKYSDSNFAKLKRVGPYGDDAPILENYKFDEAIAWLGEIVKRYENHLRKGQPVATPKERATPKKEEPTWTAREKNILEIVKKDREASLQTISRRLGRDYKDRGREGKDLSKAAINKSVNKVKDFLKGSGLHGGGSDDELERAEQTADEAKSVLLRTMAGFTLRKSKHNLLRSKSGYLHKLTKHYADVEEAGGPKSPAEREKLVQMNREIKKTSEWIYANATKKQLESMGLPLDVGERFDGFLETRGWGDAPSEAKKERERLDKEQAEREARGKERVASEMRLKQCDKKLRRFYELTKIYEVEDQRRGIRLKEKKAELKGVNEELQELMRWFESNLTEEEKKHIVGDTGSTFEIEIKKLKDKMETRGWGHIPHWGNV
jgi:hypothetical protein